MADESTTPPEADTGIAAPATGDAAPVAPMVIAAQYIKDLSFESPLGAAALSGLDQAPHVSVEVNTSIRDLGDNNYELTLFLRGEANADEKVIFIAELTYGGIITLNNVPEDAVRPVLLIDGARHLFPFARSIIANITRDGGFVPLMINPIDFAAMYVQQHGMPPGMGGEEV